MAKKICFVSTTSITMKCFIIPIAYELLKLGIDVTLVCNHDASMNTICSQKGLKYHAVSMGRGIDLSGFKAIKELESFFVQEQFDLIQYCTPNASFYASLAAKKAKTPIRLYCQWGIRYVGLSGLSRLLFKSIEKRICKTSTDIRAVSMMNKAFAISEGLYKSDKAKVVGHGGTIGVDMSLFDITEKGKHDIDIRNKYGIPQNAFVFGFCGRLSRDKGSNELLLAFKNISSINQNVRLLIVGDIEVASGINSDLYNWAINSSCVIFTGKIPESDVYKYYAPMDLLVHPTYREGFGMVIQEAGAYGIPCITTNIPGASEVMVDEESCVLINSKNAEELEKAMCRFIDDHDLINRLGIAAYERTKTLYNRPVMLKYQTDDYLLLLGR